MSKTLDDSEDRSGRSRWSGYAQIGLVLAVIAVALYFARAPERVQRDALSGVAAENLEPVVGVIRPAPADRSLTVRLTGAVRLEEKATVVSEVTGRVAWVSPSFSNGGSVAANEPLVRIDPTEFELEVEAAEQRVKAAQARLWIEQARGEEDARKYSIEHPGSPVPDLVRRAPWIAKAEAGVARAQAMLKLARLHLDRTSISLPYDARVVSSDVEVGEVVGPDDLVGALSSLGVVYRTEALEVDAPIEPKELAYLAPAIGRDARVRTGEETFDAKVVRVSSTVAPKTRLASLFLKFAERHAPDSLPRPGTFAEIEIDGPSYKDVYVLPESVLQEHYSVWVVEDGVLKSFAPKTLGHTGDGWVVEVFDAGDGLVVGTLPGAREGLAVEAKDAATQG